MPKSILIDAGPLIALFDRDDKYHEKIKAFIKGKNWRFVTTVAVLTEVSYMLNFNVNVQIDFFDWVMLKGVILHEIGADDMIRVVTLTRTYCNVPMDFADATLVIAAEKTGIKSIISIDSDFDIYRLPGKSMIENIFRG
ncbi:pilus biogenesis protein [Spirochaetia bacterium]|nr:pilus biogenesis protein [Spirochaetia bacterium]